MDFEKVYTVKKETSEKKFLKQVIIGLSNDDKSPANIMNSKFGEISEFKAEILVLSADVIVNYSGSIGYDREETYYENQKYYDSDLKMYRTKQVEKTRTVTDWQAYNGMINVNKADYAINENSSDYELARLFPKAIKETIDENVLEEGNSKVNTSAYKSALEGCKTQAMLDVDWPGDHQKDQRYTYKTNDKSLVCYIVPCYEVSFEYNGTNYRARGFAMGNANEVHEMPEPDGTVESIEIIEKRRKEKDSEIDITNGIICGVGGVLGFILAVMGFVALGNNNTALKLIGFIGLGLAILVIIISLIVRKIRENKNDELAFSQEAELKNIKKNLMNKKLKELGLVDSSESKLE